MKLSFFAVLIILIFSIPFQAQTERATGRLHNRIDDVGTALDIERLLGAIDKKRFERFTVNEQLTFEKPDCHQLAVDLKIKPWEKADLDGNGYTDLLVHGKDYEPEIIVIMGDGDNKFSVNALTRRSFQTCAVASVRSGSNGPTIDFRSPDESEPRKTLIYKFGDFVELGGPVREHKIERIRYETSGCFGTCPSFELDIKADRTTIYNALHYNNPDGKFKGVIDEASYNQLVGLLNYIDFPNLKDSYAVNWTDDAGCTLTITYDGGKVKKISDYGELGTFGLTRVYDMLFALRENQVWK
jgi:Domain of unknown function (DUF6438)